MGRSSSSRRRKRSKNSSQARARKRSKISRMKRESKKLRHRVSDDDSRSSMLGSSHSSSSEDSKYRSKKSRVHMRKHVVSDKKKARRRSYSSESSEDSHRARKRSGSKRKRDYKNNNKMYSKKKRKRDNNVSSTSSGSWSCPTCQSDSISSDEVEFERQRRKRGKEERDKGNSEKVERATKTSRYRSRSPSCSERSESSEYQTAQKVSVENNSRRLRSIITVANRDKEDRELSQDELKEQIVYDHDDYPSSRSNDSNDTGRQREVVDNYPHIEQEKKMRLENEKGEDTVVSDFRIPKNANSGNVSDKDDGDQFNGKSCFDEFGKANTVSEQTSEVSGSIGGANTDDLESVLRQRALENLRRFRGGPQTSGCTGDNQRGKGDGDTKQSSVANAELVQIKSPVEDDTKIVGANSTKEDGAKVVVSTETQLAKGIRVPKPRKDTGAKESVSPEQIIAGSINETTVAGNSKENVKVGILALKPKLVRPVLTRQLSKTDSTLKLAAGQQELQSELLVTKGSSEETYAVAAPTVVENINNNNTDVNILGGSTALEPCSLKSTSGETSSDKLQDEASESSQFQQKTMSVMRGGEMVQVSYKVYIPNKAPALARRQLKR